MRLQGLAAFLIRMFGIVLAYYCIVQGIGFFVMYRMMPEFSMDVSMISSGKFALVLTPFVILVSAALSMTVFPLTVSKNLIPFTQVETNTHGLAYLAVSLMGLYFVANTLLYGTDDFSRMILLWSVPMTEKMWTAEQLAQIVWFSVRIVAGGWLLFNRDRVVKILHEIGN